MSHRPVERSRTGQRFYSSLYDDIYFDNQHPEAEKQFVFIAGNHLPGRLGATQPFVIAELGFGFGVNCALAILAAHEVGAAHNLKFFSVEESFPDAADIAALVPLLPRAGALLNEIWRQRLALVAGKPSNILGAEVQVYPGSATDFLNASCFAADAWFLDGFSPAKNPAMWSEEILAAVFAHTLPGGTFATYTAAGWVRRNLKAVGFNVERKPGYSGKREMLTGTRPRP